MKESHETVAAGHRRFLLLVVLLAGILGATGDVHAYYHPTLGRFVQRDREEYGDGMNLYEYVGSSPIIATDPSGTYLCFFNTETKRPLLMKLIKILAKDARIVRRGSRGKEVCCVDVKTASNTAAKLVKELADFPTKVIWLRSGRKTFYQKSKVTIWFSKDYAREVFFTQEWDSLRPIVKQRKFPMGDTELAIVMAHEMIHAYYMGIKEQDHSNTIEESHIFGNHPNGGRIGTWGVNFKGKTEEEELYAVGMDIASYDKRNKIATITKY